MTSGPYDGAPPLESEQAAVAALVRLLIAERQASREPSRFLLRHLLLRDAAAKDRVAARQPDRTDRGPAMDAALQLMAHDRVNACWQGPLGPGSGAWEDDEDGPLEYVRQEYQQWLQHPRT